MWHDYLPYKQLMFAQPTQNVPLEEIWNSTSSSKADIPAGRKKSAVESEHVLPCRLGKQAEGISKLADVEPAMEYTAMLCMHSATSA